MHRLIVRHFVLVIFLAASASVQATFPAGTTWWSTAGQTPSGCHQDASGACIEHADEFAACRHLEGVNNYSNLRPTHLLGTAPGRLYYCGGNHPSCMGICSLAYAKERSSPRVCQAGIATLTGTNCDCTGNASQVGSKCVGGKSNGACGTVSNPCNPASGNKYQRELIYRGAGVGGLELALSYNTHDPLNEGFGHRWRYSYNRKVVTEGANRVVFRGDGRALLFTPSDGSWVTDADTADVLVETTSPAGWEWRAADREEIETFDAAGRLLSIRARSGLTQIFVYSDGTSGANGGFVLSSTTGNPTTMVLPAGLLIRAVDPFGRVFSFGYDYQSRVIKAIDPASGVYRFYYTNPGMLSAITFPDNKSRAFHYNESANTGGAFLPHALTGITDENGVRFATYQYNSDERVTRTEHAGAVNGYDFSYSAGSTMVTDPLGSARTYSFSTVLGAYKNTGISGAAGPQHGPASQTFDANGNVAARVDWNGNRTGYTYDLARNLETSRTEGLTAGGAVTPQTRTVTTQWHGSFRLPTAIAEPLRITTSTYDPDGSACGARGALCSRTVQATTDADGAQGFSATATSAPRTTTYIYNANGSVLNVHGPRIDAADSTAYTYYANDDADPGKRGNVSSISNALGHTTNITAYNAHGQPLTIVDPNGLTTTLTYDARQRLTSRAVGPEVTTYDYDGVGQLIKVVLPDGSYLNYGYDAAHRLTSISDNLGNGITYALDAMGNRTVEQVSDPSGALAQKRSREFSNLNRLLWDLGAQGQKTEFAYDNQGNVLSVKDPLDKLTLNQYDALNRLKQVTDPGARVTHYGYNGLDALTSVGDPRNLVTGYTVDGLGNLNQQVSPDTGTTTNTYDVAGNLLTQTDAKGQLTTYAYDALNRVTLITFHDGSKQAYGYDTGANGIGRLRSITELDPANQQTNQTTYAYDQNGRVLSISTAHAGQVHNLGYSYDLSGRLSGLTYPSGRTVTYGFDGLGRVNEVSTAKNSQSQVVVQNVQYHPFGGVKGYTLGNGQVYSRSIDLDGRISTYTLGSKTFGIGYDDASRIQQISDLSNAANQNNYGYDVLDRLTSANIPGTPFAYAYDAVGNRISKTVGGTSEAYTYGPTSNRIATVGTRGFIFDANGSTTNDGNNTYAYDVRGRMMQATSVIGATHYRVNALGQRIRKTNSLGDTVFHYDSNGKLIAETDPGGGVKREIFYLGDIPVAVFQ
jgi:YD repeat-containing protein